MSIVAGTTKKPVCTMAMIYITERNRGRINIKKSK